MDSVIVAEEVGIPARLLEATCVDSSQPIIDAVDGKLTRGQANDLAETLVGF